MAAVLAVATAVLAASSPKAPTQLVSYWGKKCGGRSQAAMYGGGNGEYENCICKEAGFVRAVGVTEAMEGKVVFPADGVPADRCLAFACFDETDKSKCSQPRDGVAGDDYRGGLNCPKGCALPASGVPRNSFNKFHLHRCEGMLLCMKAPPPACVSQKLSEYVSAREHATCVVQQEGELRCWGADKNKFDAARIPPNLLGQKKVKAVGVGYHFACVIRTDDKMQCFVTDARGPGALGPNVGWAEVNAAINQANPEASAIGVGDHSVCWVKKKEGTVECHGRSGHTGCGLDKCRPGDRAHNFLAIPKGLKAKNVFVGSDTACAIKETEKAVCWGYKNNKRSNVPDEWGKVKSLSISAVSVCAVRQEDSKVVCIGDEGGKNTVKKAWDNIPSDLGKVKAIEASGRGVKACVITQDDSARCWGTYNPGNGMGGTGDGRVAIIEPPTGDFKPVIAGGDFHTCAVLKTGGLECWGKTNVVNKRELTPPEGLLTKAVGPHCRNNVDDPFTMNQDGQKVQFFLRADEEALLLGCGQLKLYGHVMGTGIAGDHQQWFDRLRFVVGGQEQLLVNVKRNATSAEQLKTLAIQIDGKTISKVGATTTGRAMVAVQQQGAVEVAQFSMEDTVVEVKSAMAKKFAGTAEQKQYTHLNVEFAQLKNSECTAGILPEIWGLVPMSKQTAERLQPPQ